MGHGCQSSLAQHKEVEHGEQGQEHEEEHGKETGSKDPEREEAGKEGEEVAGPGRPTRSARAASVSWPRRMKIWGLSKRAAHYGQAPTADVRCDRCMYMFPPLPVGGCRLVRGVIRSSATCDEFKRRKTS